MKRFLLWISYFLAFAINDLLAASPCYIKTKDGVIVCTDPAFPFGPGLQYTAEKPADTITFNIYAGTNASFNLYEDEGTNYNYEKGSFSIIPILYNEATKTVTVSDRKGEYNGMLQKRTFRINLITQDRTRRLDSDAYDKEILYDGKKIEVKL